MAFKMLCVYGIILWPLMFIYCKHKAVIMMLMTICICYMQSENVFPGILLNICHFERIFDKILVGFICYYLSVVG